MSDSFGGAKRGKPANSSDIAALKRKLATAKTYTEQPLNRVFKSASDVMSLGIVNNTLQAQTYITTGAAFDIYNQLTGKIIYEGQLTGQPVDYQALLALLSAKLGIPASNLKVSVKAGSVIIEWSTLSPIVKTYTPPDVRAIVTTLQMNLLTNPVTGIGLVNGGSATASITNTTNNTSILSMPSGQLEYVLSATDTTITVNGILPGTYPYTQNSVITGVLGTSHIIASLTPNTLYTITVGNGRAQEIRTAPTITLAQSGRDVLVSGLDNATYLYSLDSASTWLVMAANRLVPNVLPGLQMIQVMLQNLSPTRGVGVTSAPVTVTLISPVPPTYTFQGPNATFTVPTLPYLNAAGYVYTLTVYNATNPSQSPAPTIVNGGIAIVNGFVLTDTYTATLSVVSADRMFSATSGTLSILLPPTPPAAPVISAVSPTSLQLVASGLSASFQYSYSTDGGVTFTSFSTASQTATGLTPGRTYSVIVRASNASGNAPSAPSNSVTLAQQPPTMASTSVSSLTLSNIGTDSTLDYAYSLNGGAWIPVSAGSSTVLVTGLTQGTPYSARVQSTNKTTSVTVISSVSNTIYLKPGTPSTPTLVVNGLVGTITNTDTPQAGSLYSYKLTTGSVVGSAVSFGSQSTATVSLAYNTAYSVIVTATSSSDSTLFTSSLPSTTQTTAPAVPSIPTVVGSGTGLMITNTDTQTGCTYTYTVLDGATQVTTGSFTSTNIATTIPLTLNTTYNVTVTATNVASSATSLSVNRKIFPTPSKPRLSLISGSYSTLLVENVDSLPEYTYYYRLSTQPVGQYTAIAGLDKSGSGYIVPNVVPNQDYTISILIGSGGGYGPESTYSDPAVKIAIPKPSKPRLSSISGSRTTLLVDNVDSLPGFTYYYRLNVDPEGIYNPISNLEKSGSGYILRNLAFIQEYSIGIVATFGGVYGEPTYSDVVNIEDIPKPSKPTLSLISGSLTTLLLGDVDSTPGYTYHYRLNTEPIGQSTPISNLEKSGSGYIVPNVVPNQDYSIGIIAKTEGVYGPESEHSSPVIRISMPKPSTPTLSLIAGSVTSLLLGNVDSVAGYTYYYYLSTQGFDPYKPILSLEKSGSGYIVKGLVPDQDYSIAIIAGNGLGSYGPLSEYSATVKIPIPKPSTPTLTWIPGSYTSLLLGNVDSLSGLTYYFRLNTDPIGASTAISTLEKSGNGYIVKELVPGQDYSIGIIAAKEMEWGGGIYRVNGPESTYSTTIQTIPIPSKPTLSVITGSYTTLLLENVVSLSEYTYYYRLSTDRLGQYTAISNLEKSGNAYIVPNLIGNQDYTISIIASPSAGVYGSESIYSSPAVRIPIPTPTLTTIPGSYTTLLLGNVDSLPIQTYYYRLSTQVPGTYTAITTLDKSGNGYIVSGLTPDLYYAIVIVAKSGSGIYGSESVWSSPGIKTAPIPKPSTPTLSLIAGSTTSLLVENVDSTPGLTYYYRLNTQSAGTYTAIVSLEKSGNGYIVPNLIGNQDYMISIVAKVGGVFGPESIYSSPAVSIYLSTPTPTLRVTNYTSVTIGNIPNNPGITYEYSIDNGTTYITVTGGVTQVVTGLVAGTSYVAYIRAKSGTTVVGTSAPSNSVTIPALNTVSTPTLSVTSFTSITVGNIDTFSGYTYEYSIDNGITYNPVTGGSTQLVTGLTQPAPYAETKEPYVAYVRAKSGSTIIATSSASNSINTLIATPTLAMTGSYTSVTIGNIPTIPGYTYDCSVDGGATYSAVTGGSVQVLTGLTAGSIITAYIYAKSGNTIICTSLPSNLLYLGPPAPTLYIQGFWLGTIGNIDNYPGYTYEYSIDGTTYYPVSPAGSTQQTVDVVPGTEYEARTRVKLGNTILAYSQSFSAPATPPRIPKPSLTTASSTSIRVFNVDTSQYAYYDYSLDGQNWYSLANGTTSFIVTGLRTYSPYSVRLRASNGRFTTYSDWTGAIYVS
jgi:hypothetical protein